MEKNNEIHLENFDGPLDLLLTLVKDNKMDILTIDLSELATSYLKIIENLKDTDLDLASEYLVMATTLLQLKSKILLDDPRDKEKIEEERKNILSKLIEYQQFKKIAEKLKEKKKERENIFIKDVHDYSNYQFKVDMSQLDIKSDSSKLIKVLRKMFERTYAQKLKNATVEKFKLSPAERRLEILEILKTTNNPTFEEIFNVPTINHFVVTILTVLDMSRKQELIIKQSRQFGEIKFIKGVINE